MVRYISSTAIFMSFYRALKKLSNNTKITNEVFHSVEPQIKMAFVITNQGRSEWTFFNFRIWKSQNLTHPTERLKLKKSSEQLNPPTIQKDWPHHWRPAADVQWRSSHPSVSSRENGAGNGTRKEDLKKLKLMESQWKKVENDGVAMRRKQTHPCPGCSSRQVLTKAFRHLRHRQWLYLARLVEDNISLYIIYSLDSEEHFDV